MSEPTAAPGGAKEKRGISKVLGKVKTVFHMRGSSSRKEAPSQPIVERPAVLPSPPPEPPAREVPHYEGATKVPRIQVHEERMKKLGARFGIEIKPSEFHSSEGEVLRVDKPVRMRIHRQCHLCESRIGVGNECSSCHHVRCRQCSRHPEKQTETERQANRDKREALIQKNRDMAPILPSYDYSAPQIELQLPGKTEGSILVHKGRPRMRVRRYCHECNTLITAQGQQARKCEKCGHRRCADCPRYPADKKSYPYGYPNDEPGPINKGVFACHECKAKFDPEAEDGTKCPECPHEKCPQCPRVRPRKIIPKPDPSILKSIQLRIAEIEGMQHDMAELRLSDD